MKKIKLLVKRIALKDDYTIGKLYINNEYFCDTLEDKVRVLNSKEDKVYGKTAIPAGVYKVTLSMSNKFKRILPYIHDVPYFEGIRIHSGNTSNDSLGCILVGINNVVGKVTSSRNTEEKLMKILENSDEITIEIV